MFVILAILMLGGGPLSLRSNVVIAEVLTPPAWLPVTLGKEDVPTLTIPSSLCQ